MNYKLIALDLDGTLLTTDKKISQKNKEVLQKAMEKGVHVVLASGRPVNGMKNAAQELGLYQKDNYILSFNGGRIINIKTGECLFQADLPEGYLEKCHELAQKCGIGFVTYKGNDILITNDDNEYIQLEQRLNQLTRISPENIEEYVNFPVAKYLMAGDPALVEKAEPIFKEMAGEALNVFRSDPFFLEILPPGIDKAFGLEKLIQILNIKREEVIACGDGYNDITMLKYAGLGVAMQNANDQAKAAADEITLSNDEDGVAAIVEKYIL